MAAGIGLALVTIGVLGDFLISGAGWGFGTSQLVVVFLGALVLVAAWLGRRLAAVYRGVALLLLNTLVLLLVVEVFAAAILAILTIVQPGADAGAAAARGRRNLTYYTSREWGATYWDEYARVSSHTTYRPYVIWRSSPFRGRTITVEEHSYTRRTPGSDCSAARAFKIFTFGGSGMWGVGSPDSATVPAHLQAMLSREGGRPVCIVNFGERGHVSTQGVIQLLRQLQRGNVPDLVLFYDGVNDVFTATAYNQPGLHMSMDRVAEKLETTGPLAADWLEFSRLFRLLAQLTSRGTAESRFAGPSAAPDTLAGAVVQVYLANYRAVEALAGEFGFAFKFFWQPHILAGAKPLTAEERAIRSADARGEHAAVMAATFARVERLASQYEHLHYAGHVFDSEPSLAYIDSHHLTPEANALVARRMLEVIRPRMAPSDTRPGTVERDTLGRRPRRSSQGPTRGD